MCGIAGIISRNCKHVTYERLKLMADAVAHRGPDGEGFWLNKDSTAGFGHRRLSIIDLSEAGHQPMHYHDRYTIIHNGEIYNYIEIRHDLQKNGFSFRSQTDTEVILAAYACYKERCLDYFDGMFAFAIWDEISQTLFAARDRFGEKPFYYSADQEQHEFIFGSEMKALWSGGITKTLNNFMVLNYLTLGYLQNPSQKSETFFSNIRSLPPSHYLRYDFRTGKLQTCRYYNINPDDQFQHTDIRYYTDNFLSHFNTSIHRRLRSDVSVGTSLSGGLDSSSIIAAIKHSGNASGPKKSAFMPKTFSAVFPGFGKDESKHIDILTRNFNIANYRVIPSADELIQDFEKLCYHQEEPFSSSSIYAQYKVYELAKKHKVTVLLDGQGADEILAGYTKYIHWYLQELLNGKHTRVKEQIKALRNNHVGFFWNWKNYVAALLPVYAAKQLQKRELKKQNRHPDIADDFFFQNNRNQVLNKPVVRKLNDILYFNTFEYGLEELLRYSDRNAMAHGREVRLPFLSHEFVEFIFKIPSTFKIRDGFTKHILRLSMNDYLPEEIVWRTDKIGYEPPQKQWMENPALQDYIHEAKRALVKKGILKPGVLNKKNQPQDAYAADNFDWRYLVAGRL